MLRRKYTQVDERYLSDYAYKNLKPTSFSSKYQEKNVCSIIFWKNDTRLTIIRGLLSFSYLFDTVKVRRKQVSMRYNTKKPKEGTSFLQFILSIIDIFGFLLLICICDPAKMRFIYDSGKTKVKGIIYTFAIGGVKINWTYSENKNQIFSNYVAPYVNRRRVLKDAFTTDESSDES